jgi:Arc/MetJ family transcription regulator
VATNLALDDKLIDEARRIGGHTTKKEAVTAALAEYIQRRKQLEILKAFGTIEFDPSWDYQRMRKLDRSRTGKR